MGAGGWEERQEKARGEGKLIGLGFCSFAERTGYGTRAFALRKMAITPGGDNARLRMDPSGHVTVSVGTCGHGQGHQTTLAQIAADGLGISPETITVRQGDTESTPYGWGTFASRSAVIGGGATKKAAAILAERVKEVAGHLLEAAPADLEIQDGNVLVKGSPEHHVSVAKVARAVHVEPHLLPEGEAGTLDASAGFDPPGTFSNATHGVAVEVDPETGEVRIDRYVVVEDCGVVINPMIVEGQVRGGVAQGIAAALYERLVYDDEGQLVTSTLMDYLIPVLDGDTARRDLPPGDALRVQRDRGEGDGGGRHHRGARGHRQRGYRRPRAPGHRGRPAAHHARTACGRRSRNHERTEE